MMPSRSSSTQSPLISVIVRCYNQARFLPDAVRSLQDQTYPRWECLIINDGSTDDTAAVGATLAASEPRVYLINQANRGRCGALNRGLAEAPGEFLQFLDADDLLEKNKFAWQANVLRGSPKFGIVYGDVRYFPSDAPAVRRFSLFDPDVPWVEPAWRAPAPLLNTLLTRNVMAINCPLVRRSVVERVGFFDERLLAVEDWDYWLRCAAAGAVFHFAPAPDTLALVRIHPASVSQDRTLMHRAMFQLSLHAGRRLSDPVLRRRNLWISIERLQWCYPSFSVRKVYSLLRAAWANRSLLVFCDCLRYLAAAAARRARPKGRGADLLRRPPPQVSRPVAEYPPGHR